MIVAEPHWEQDGLRIEVRRSGHPGGEPLWFRRTGAAPPERAPAVDDVAAVALLPHAMAHGQPLHVVGRVSREQLCALDEFQEAWHCWRPDLFAIVPLSADDERSWSDPGPPRRGATAAFSGGVDATYQLVAHLQGLIGRRARSIRRAVLVHGFDIPLADVAGFDRAAGEAEAVLAELGVPLTRVTTNWRAFCPDWPMTFAVGVASVLHGFAGDSGVGLLAADEPYDLEIHPWGSNSVTNGLLGAVGFPIESTGFGVSRTAKCRAIGTIPAVRRHVRVCWAGRERGRNCGACEKCIRTQLGFMAAGVGPVEALAPLRPGDVRRLRVHNVQQLQLLRDILATPGDGLPTPLARVLRRVVWREEARLGLRAVARGFIRRAPRLRSLLRGIRRAARRSFRRGAGRPAS